MSNSNLTRIAIATSTKKLLREMSFSKITVKKICETTGISRRSFYNHFSDIYDVIIWIFETEFYNHYKNIEKIDYFNDFVFELCQYFYNNMAFYRKVLPLEGQNSLRLYITKEFTELFIDDVMIGIRNKRIAKIFIESLWGITILLIINWFDNKNDVPPKEFVDGYKITCANAGYNFGNQALGLDFNYTDFIENNTDNRNEN
ncbi:TetR family transcriptional regulator [Acidaminobacter sp. JC074]|uniref:TetR/AcrR family transcriptional regulator C-terminal domain-containing protein n=1 Tax=Acidaminobacter sp. JC074 TaxID=2530199 RepID=UPI001F0F37B6|nr:TetR/AcrR family transcriptional regulator C-terminal domain-containing protein [Acidaminobacter sp. JC074]MCH4891094.1 TetR family transcriptional regulator [Acidaminobacter sp. JC074]